MVAAKQGEVVVCCFEEERVPQAENESRRERSLPGGVLAERQLGR